MRFRPCIYGTADDVAALAQRLRPRLLAWARRTFPSINGDHEDVLQEVLVRLTLDNGARGTEDHVRACLYHGLRCGLINQLRHERARHSENSGHFQAVFDEAPDPDTRIDPLACAIRTCEEEVLASVIAPYSEVEQRLIRLRYRGDTRARKNDGVISRVQCADLLGITLAELRAMEHRVFGRLAIALKAGDVGTSRSVGRSPSCA